VKRKLAKPRPTKAASNVTLSKKVVRTQRTVRKPAKFRDSGKLVLISIFKSFDIVLLSDDILDTLIPIDDLATTSTLDTSGMTKMPETVKIAESLHTVRRESSIDVHNATKTPHMVKKENTSDPGSSESKLIRKRAHWKRPKLVQTKRLKTASNVTLFQEVIKTQRTVRKPAKFRDSGKSLMAYINIS
jgi:hypothetical protein